MVVQYAQLTNCIPNGPKCIYIQIIGQNRTKLNKANCSLSLLKWPILILSNYEVRYWTNLAIDYVQCTTYILCTQCVLHIVWLPYVRSSYYEQCSLNTIQQQQKKEINQRWLILNLTVFLCLFPISPAIDSRFKHISSI